MWPVLFGEIVGCLIIMEFFTTAVLISNEAWTPGIVLVCTLTPALVVSTGPTRELAQRSFCCLGWSYRVSSPCPSRDRCG